VLLLDRHRLTKTRRPRWSDACRAEFHRRAFARSDRLRDTGLGLHPVPARDVRPAGGPRPFEARYLSRDGNVRFKTREFFVSQTLAHGRVGVEEVADGVWNLNSFDRRLAGLDSGTSRCEGDRAAP